MCATSTEAVVVLNRLLAQAAERWPGICSTLEAAKAAESSKTAAPECGRCQQLLAGLSNLSPLQGTKLSQSNAIVRRHLDSLVRTEFEGREAAAACGYIMGQQRWAKAAEPEQTINAGGRPSKVNDPEVIAAVRAALEQKSQPSSNICKKDNEWVVAKTMTDTRAGVYQSNEQVYNMVSESTFRRVLNSHMTEYKRPRALSDYCQHCYDLDHKVLPDLERVLKEQRAALQGLMECYFAEFDRHAAQCNLSFEQQPGLYVQEIEHFINRHCEARPCARHARSNFPCGQLRLPQRGSGFPQRKRFDLHETEASTGHLLRSHLKLLVAYLRHRNAKDLQHKALTALLESPPLGTAVLLSDWKELETLPQCWKATGDQFFAQARHEVSVWGALLVEHDASSTVEKPQLLQTYMLFVSKVLDHTALRTNQLVRLALENSKSSKPWERLCVVSACGPHYRSLESIAHHLVTLRKLYSIPVEVHFGCEKHLKSAIDRLFGWVRAILKRSRDRRQDILSVEDMASCLKKGFQENLAARQNSIQSHLNGRQSKQPTSLIAGPTNMTTSCPLPY